MQMTNLKVTLEPETTLFKEEVDAIIAIIEDTIDRRAYDTGSNLDEGSFVLYGKKDGEDKVQEMIAFDFESGPSIDCLFYSRCFFGTGSREIAENVTKRDLTNIHDKPDSHISYFRESPLFLSLKTTSGRFACACYGRDFSYKDMTFVYCAFAQAIACMGKEDKVLQESCDHIFFSQSEEYHELGDLRDHIEELYRECALPELKLWKKWHDAESENLTLFFE